MKFVSLMLLALSFNALAAHRLVGKYQAPKTVAAFSFNSEESCLKAEGKWEEGACFFTVNDTVEIKDNMDGSYRIVVSTLGHNLHMCDYDQLAVAEGRSIVSRVGADVYNPRTGTFEQGMCEVKATRKSKKLSIKTNGKCQEFCGANAWLDVSGLSKVK